MIYISSQDKIDQKFHNRSLHKTEQQQQQKYQNKLRHDQYMSNWITVRANLKILNDIWKKKEGRGGGDVEEEKCYINTDLE